MMNHRFASAGQYLFFGGSRGPAAQGTTTAYEEVSFAQSEESILHAEESMLQSEESILHAEESMLHSEESILHAEESMPHPGESILHAEEACAYTSRACTYNTNFSRRIEGKKRRQT